MTRLNFRVWDKDLKTIVSTEDNLTLQITNNELTVAYSDSLHQITNYELLKSTGLFDKNGTEIYEGDIIDKGYYNMSIENRIGYVQFSQGGDSDGWAHGEWLGWITDNHDSLLDVHEHCTVLGNKFEHPHLLEEE